MPAKKNTKLSLKKSISEGKLKDQKPILPASGCDNMNETCEFQQPAVFRGNHGNVRVKPEKLDAGQSDPGHSEDEVLCQVCSKNLSHMNVQRRQQHVNRCVDKVEDEERQQELEKKMLESARTAVLNCPMCGKQFKTENARKGHLKRCAQSLGVTTERMLVLVKEQEDERNTQLAAGVIPEQLRASVTKQKMLKKKKIKEPKNQFEEDVQIAMALSSSLAADSEQLGPQSDKEREKKRKKQKASMEDVCLLTTLTDTDRRRRIEEKISDILHQNDVNETAFPSLELSESGLKAENQQNGTSLWDRCSRVPEPCDLDMFYVGALVPPLSINTVKPGASLRRMSSIPGREKSFIVRQDAKTDKVDRSLSNISCDDVITASTQTAVVLAELAVDSADISQTQISPRKSLSSFIDLQASGFCMEKLVLPDSEQALINVETLGDFKGLINSKEYSDVIVQSATGDKFQAHRLVLAARCPKLLQMTEDSVINVDAPSDVVLSLLEFIYCGNLAVASTSQTEIENLAEKLEFKSLMAACSKLELKKDDPEQCQGNNQAEGAEFEESQLDLKAIWGESDSDSEREDIETATCDSDSGRENIRTATCDSDSERENIGAATCDSDSGRENIGTARCDSDSGREDKETVELDSERESKQLVTCDSDSEGETSKTARDISSNMEKENRLAENKSTDSENCNTTSDKVDLPAEDNETAGEESILVSEESQSSEQDVEMVKLDDGDSSDGIVAESKFSFKAEVKKKKKFSSHFKNSTDTLIEGRRSSGKRVSATRKASAFQVGTSVSDMSFCSISQTDFHSDNDTGIEVIEDINPVDGNSKRRSFKRTLNSSGEESYNEFNGKHSLLPNPKRLKYNRDRRRGLNSSTENGETKLYLDHEEFRETPDCVIDVPLKGHADYTLNTDSADCVLVASKAKALEITTDTSDHSDVDLNSSAVDLFESPSPKKSGTQVRSAVLNGMQNLAHNSCLSIKSVSNCSQIVPLGNCINLNFKKSQSGKQNSQNEIIHDQYDLNSQNEVFHGQREVSHSEKEKTLVRTSLTDGCDKNGGTYNLNDTVVRTTRNNFCDRVDGICIDDGSDEDDIEITGDNFHEISQQSPTFSSSKSCSLNNSYILNDSKIIRTKYLGIQSSVASLAHNKENQRDQESGERYCSETGNPILADSNGIRDDDDEEIVLIETKGDDVYSVDEENKEVTDKRLDGASSDVDISIVGTNTEKSMREITVLGHEKENESCERGISDTEGKDTAVNDDIQENSSPGNHSFGYDNEGVWDDFEDCGVINMPVNNSPMDVSPAKSELTIVDLPEIDVDKTVEEVNNLDSALLEDGDDSFVFKVDEDENVLEKPSSQYKRSGAKTPVASTARSSGKRPWVPPSPFTPMPEYGAMPTPALKKEIQRFGVKPVSKKRMVKMLQDIYQQTHQYITDSELEEESDSDILPEDSRKKKDTDSPLFTKGSSKSRVCNSMTDVDMNCSQSQFSSQESDTSELQEDDVLEESCLHMACSDSDTSSSPQKSADVTKKMFDYFRSNPEIHTKVLTYEPLELDILKKDMKTAGIKCSMDKLMDFLDERCIAFTTKNSRKRQPTRRGRKNKKGTSDGNNPGIDANNRTDS